MGSAFWEPPSRQAAKVGSFEEDILAAMRRPCPLTFLIFLIFL
jgi:hypothetical protein